MSVAERICQHLQKLDGPLQVEVFDFVKYLESKVEHQTDELTWSDLSLSLAMRGMKDEESYSYTTEDLKEIRRRLGD
ncbi:MAG: hypothetical protein QME42_07285 [bacterium]|nr:hypothetical protein [bacterium]